MSKFRTIKNSFIGGEISPTAMGRTDLPQYPHACKTLRNCIPFLSGGAYGRPGTFFENSLSAVTDYAPRLIPFVFSKSEAYCLLMGKVVGGAGYIVGYRSASNTTVATSPNITGAHSYLAATIANANGFYDDWHDVHFIQSADVMYFVHPNYKPLRLRRTAADTFKLAEFDTDSSGTMLTGAAFREAWPYQNQNATATTLTINTASVGTGRTLTASAALFNVKHIGAVFKVNNGAGTVGCCKVTAFTSSTVVTVQVVAAFGDTSAHTTWWESSWSDYRGWPRTIAFHKDRLIYGGNTFSPDRLWFTQTSNYDVLSTDLIVDQVGPGNGASTGPKGLLAFQKFFNSRQLNQIQWMDSNQTFLVGTSGDEYIVDLERPNDPTIGFGADNISAQPSSHYGSSHHQSVRVGSEVFFCLGAEDEIRSLVFNQFENSYVADNVQLLFDHYPKVEQIDATLSNPGSGGGNRKFRAFTWDESRSTLWCVDTMGSLFGLTHDRRLQVNAWHTHQMGGFDATKVGGTVGATTAKTIDPAYYLCSGSVLSVVSLPNSILGYNDVWLLVKRKINGAFVYQVERIIGKHMAYETVYTYVSNGVGNYYVDSAVFGVNDYPFSEDYIFSGLGNLEGETPSGTASNTKGLVVVTGDAVASGSTNLQQPYPPHITSEATAVIFGLPFDSIIEPVRLEAGSVIGSAQAAIKRIHYLTVRFFRTLCAKVGGDSEHLHSVKFRVGSTPMGQSSEIYSGDKLMEIDANWSREELGASIYILKDKPLPFAVVGIVAEGMTDDG